jgi:metallo-beta-lactamase family protein
MHIQFCGAAGEVTGSCTRLDIENATLLIDCGLFQGQKYSEDKNFDPFPFKAEEIDAVLLTHAHLDHCGRLPKLVNQGFAGKIYATDATRDLTQLILLDSAGIMKEEGEREDHPPLFTEEDVLHTMERFVTLPYDREVQIATGVSAQLYNAGHVLGSSFIAVKGEGKSIIFSGDIGNHPVPLLPEPEKLPQASAMVLESTYGDRLHESFEDGVKALQDAITATVHDKGVLLVPAFSLERTQELLTTIDKMLNEHKIPQISAYLDGPLGIKISGVYEKYDRYFKDDIKETEKKEADHSVLQFPSLTYTETADQSRMINEVDPPKMIIAGSGMMHGGRILHHLKRYLPLPNTRLLIVGYQAVGTLGRTLQDGATHVKIHGEDIMVKAQIISTHGFSSHMDKDQLVEWIKSMPEPPQAIFLNHGDDDARKALSENLTKQLGHTKVEVPAYTAGYTL